MTAKQSRFAREVTVSCALYLLLPGELASCASVGADPIRSPQLSSEERARAGTGESNPPDARKADTATLRLYDLMFGNEDRPAFPGGTERHLEQLAQTVPSSSDAPGSAESRVIQLSAVCRPLMTLLQRYSPNSDRYSKQVANKDLRQRTLICDVSSSMEFADRAGATRVGDLAIVREEPHSSFSGSKVKGSDLDILRVSLLADRILRSGDFPPGYFPQLLHDVGGFLWANSDYFLNADPDTDVEMADKKEIEQAGREIMITITELMRRRSDEPNGHARVEKVLWDNQEYFEKLAKKD
jgi:hypothetical protein